MVHRAGIGGVGAGFRAGLVLASALGFAYAAPGQTYPKETLTYSVEWENAPSPGVAAKGAVWATLSPDSGTKVLWANWQWPSEGTLMAFASSIFNLANVQNATTGTLAWTVPTAFNIAGKPGTPDGNGGISQVNSGQFAFPTNPSPIVTQKVKLLDLAWSTDDFSFARFVEFQAKATSGKVYLDVGLAAWVGENCVKVDGSGGFWVVPSPSGWALMALAGVAATRRRRK